MWTFLKKPEVSLSRTVACSGSLKLFSGMCLRCQGSGIPSMGQETFPQHWITITCLQMTGLRSRGFHLKGWALYEWDCKMLLCVQINFAQTPLLCLQLLRSSFRIQPKKSRSLNAGEWALVSFREAEDDTLWQTIKLVRVLKTWFYLFHHLSIAQKLICLAKNYSYSNYIRVLTRNQRGNRVATQRYGTCLACQGRFLAHSERVRFSSGSERPTCIHSPPPPPQILVEWTHFSFDHVY